MGDVQADDAATAETPQAAEPQLPKLSAHEFRQYNRLAEHMDMFVTCENNKRPAGMSIRQFIGLGLEFCHHLDVHHSIEERHIFPVLAQKMPAFRKELELLTQHKQIHKGLEKLEKYLEDCRRGEDELRMDKMREILDTFGKVLWQHLDEEVKELGAENMRKYWSIEEVRRIPM
ncbi:hypothetical protein SLS58_010833 [Diplodia intermedia]|uniref:Hemerythrin-like domain-containing protein n=1 Tax=Diplodia intermedia TaxID=856260 RepID=A0ABR3T3E1_9PEZI